MTNGSTAFVQRMYTRIIAKIRIPIHRQDFFSKLYIVAYDMNYKIFFSIIFLFVVSVLIYLYLSNNSSDDDEDQANTTLSYLNFMNSSPGGLVATQSLARFFDEE